MSQKKALKIVTILFSISLIALIVTGVLKKTYPEKFDANQKEQEINNAVEQERANDELPINEMAASQTTKNNRNVWSWPYDSTVPIYHNIDLNLYQNRLKDETALTGIKVYLSATRLLSKPRVPDSDSPVSTANPSSNFASASGQAEDQTGLQESEVMPDSNQGTGESETNELLNASTITEQELDDILNDILTYTKNSLEKSGAEVEIIKPEYQTDVEKAAYIGEDILIDFETELNEQKFKSDRLQNLLPTLQQIRNGSADSKTINALFPQIGVSAKERMLLDVERQFSNRIFLNIRFGTEESDINGSLVHFLGNQSANIGSQSETISSEQAEQPAYIAYDAENRQRFASLMSKNISQLVPGLTYSGDEPVKESILPSLRLINLNALEIEVGQRYHDFDIQILTSEEQQKIFAEAINNSVYEFYCTNLE